jgi:hypothetical protein
VSLITLTPSSDRGIGSAWSKNGFSGSYSAALSDGNDATYGSVNSSASTGGHLQLTLSAIPGNVLSMLAVSIALRCLVASTKGTPELQAQVWNSAGTTALTSKISVIPTTSFSTISVSATLNDSTLSDWSFAYLDIQNTDDSNNTTLEVSEASVVLTVVLASAPIAKIINNSMVVSCNSVF